MINLSKSWESSLSNFKRSIVLLANILCNKNKIFRKNKCPFRPSPVETLTESLGRLSDKNRKARKKLSFTHTDLRLILCIFVQLRCLQQIL